MKSRIYTSARGLCILFAVLIVLLDVTVGQAQSGNAKEIKRDGRWLIAYDDDTVLDKTTGLMWAAYDNGSDITWEDAKKYCENFKGGGYKDWRMPTQEELAALYDARKEYQTKCGATGHLTALIELSCTAVWGTNTRGPGPATFFFSSGGPVWFYLSHGFEPRALPVRSTK